MNIKFLGHSAFLIESSKGNFLIDPFLKGNPLCTTSLEDLPSIDYILITHGHIDHIGDSAEIAQKFNSTVIASPEVCQYLGSLGVSALHPVAISGNMKLDFGYLRVVDALHSSSLEINNQTVYMGVATGLVLTIDDTKIYHAGDTGRNINMTLLKKDKIDIAILPIGGNYTMDVEDANESIHMLEPKTVIPMHYNTFELIKADPTKLKNPYGKVDILNPNDTLSY